MKTRLYFILAPENLFHPYYLQGVIENLDKSKYRVIGVSIPLDKNKYGLIKTLNFQLQLWGVMGFISIIILSLFKTLIDQLGIKNYSIRSIAKKYNFKYIQVKDVNDQNHLNYLKKLKIDILISSNGHIFKKPLLDIPKIACINRHTGLLPKYGGVLPLFWTTYNNEKQFGVSIHYMVEKIDQGDILYKKALPLKVNNSLFKNYILGFNLSIEATLKALFNIKQKKIQARFYPNKKQYFSVPTTHQMQNFRKNHKTFEMVNIIELFRTTKLYA